MRQTMDQVEEAVDSICQLTKSRYSHRLHSIYLGGSYARNEADLASDLDFSFVFKGKVSWSEHLEFQKYFNQLSQICYIPLDFNLFSETALRRKGDLDLLGARILFGNDIRDFCPKLHPSRATELYVDAAINSCLLLRNYPAKLRVPLKAPHPKALFLGYEDYSIKSSTGDYPPSTVNLVNALCRIASALVAIHSGLLPRSKQEAVDLYRDTFGGKWADFIERTYKLLRIQWQYRIPNNSRSIRQLQAIARTTLSFENHFLTEIRKEIPQRKFTL